MKDPAFLFYPNDYLGGTMGMSFAEKGAYIELLMLQFNRGHMTSHMIAHVLGHTVDHNTGQVVGQLWESLRNKFSQDEDGLYYNERLEQEQNKRKTFTDSRKNNVTGKNQHSKKENLKKEKKDDLGHMTSHTTSHMENRNINENRNEKESKNKGVQGEKEREAGIVVFEAEKPAVMNKEITMPWQTEAFAVLWQNWKEYRKTEHKFSYKSPQSEQAALVELSNLAEGNEALATKTVLKSMQNGWKGFFKLKDDEKKEAITSGMNKLDYFLAKDGQIKRRRVLWKGEYILTREYCDHWSFLKDSEKTQQELDDMRDVMIQTRKRDQMYAELGENLERL